MLKRVYVEITNICNLKCAFCLETVRKPRMMRPAEFESVIQNVKEHTDYVYLHVQGEPLSHPDFEEILDICDRYQMKVQLVTNATLLNRHPDLVNRSCLRKISFSLQSVEYHHNQDLHAYMNDIFSFIERASAAGRPYCELRFWRSDQKDMPATAECMRMIHERYTLKETNRRGSLQMLDGVYLSYDNMFEWPSISHDTDQTRGTCRGGIDQIAVLSDGTVIPCCLDNDGTIKLGNIFENTLAEILASQRYLNLVEGFRKHEVREELCRRCTFRYRFNR